MIYQSKILRTFFKNTRVFFFIILQIEINYKFSEVKGLEQIP